MAYRLMKKVPKLLRFIPRLGLLMGLSFLVWACGPAAPAVEEPTPAHTLQPTAIPTAEPGPFTDPVAPPAAAPDELLQEPISVVDARTLSVGEPVISSKPVADPAGEPPDKFIGQQVITKSGRSDPAGGPGQDQPEQSRPYTWEDGDRTLTVLLQDDLTVTPDGDIRLREDPAAAITRSDSVDKAASAGLPVFRSPSGALMTLPGGVLLALDEAWSEAETDAFFENNGIDRDRVSELEYLTNGFFVETEPGFPSLELANALAEQDGVVISSPNWWRDHVAR